MKNPEDTDYCIAVLGAGVMGQGIAQVAVMGGIRTLVYDADAHAAAAARERVEARLARLAEKGAIDADAPARMMARLEVIASVGQAAPADAVIEAIAEDRAAKQALFREIEAAVGDDCVIASNTSSIPIAAIARVCARKARVAGMHFFNPVPLMALVEVVRAPETADDVIETLHALAARMERTPVTVRDAPGFLVNLGGRAYATEALRIAQEGVATPAQVDAVMREACGFRMGPFELMDLTGMDVNYPATRTIHEGYMHDPRLATAPEHAALYEAGRLGRKTGAGWYAYDAAGKMVAPPSPDFTGEAAPARSVLLAEPDERLGAFCGAIGLEMARGDTPGGPVLAAPLGEDCTHLALRTGADPRRLVGVDLSCDTSKRVTLMTAPGADPAVLEAVAAAVAASGRAVTAIADSPGFVAQRIRAMVANLGCFMAEIGLAAPADIDRAMKLGLNYPLGPLEMAEDLGLDETLTVLERLQAITGDDRYRPTLWLKRRARLGLDIRTPA